MKQCMFLVLAILLLSSCVAHKSSIKKDKDVHLEQGEGYLLMAINTNISLTRLLVGGTQYFSLSNKDLRHGTNYVLLNLPAGEYEFIKAEFFGYYVEIDSEDTDWSFQIEPNAISYVGDLELETIWGKSVNMELTNNASSALEFMEEKFPNILSVQQLKYHGPGNDDFFDIVSNKINLEAK